MDLCELEFNPNWQGTRHPWERARVKVVKNLLKPLLNEKKGRVNILDVGSGDAYLVHQLVSQNERLFAHCVDIEYTDDIVRSLNEQVLSKRIRFYKSMEEYRQANPDQTIDIALFLDVIEHVEDDVALLKEVTKSPNFSVSSHFLVTVPAFQSLFSAHDVFLKHYRRYTIELLEQSVSRAGGEISKTGYFFFSLFLARKLQKLLSSKDEVNQKGISAYKPIFPLDQLFLGILLADYFFFKAIYALGFRTPGLSCYALCHSK